MTTKTPLHLPALVCVFILVASCAPKLDSASAQPTVSPPPNVRTLEGKLKNQVDMLEKNMPRAFSEEFIIPTDLEKTDFSEIISSIENGNIDNALQLADKNLFELLWYTDGNDENASSFLLRETASPARGWGLYLLRAGSNSNIIIEAPHPLADEGSPP